MESPSTILALFLLLALICQSGAADRSKRSCTRPGETSISYRGDGEGALPQIYDALVTCAEIWSLRLDMTMSGCVLGSQPWTFDFQGDRFPPLEHLSLSKFDFKSDRPAKLGWQSSTGPVDYFRQQILKPMLPAMGPSVPRSSEPTLERWLHAMDFTKVKSLEINEDPYFCARMQHELPGLRNLTMHLANSISDAARGFLQAVPPLEHLSLRAASPYFTTLTNPTEQPFLLRRSSRGMARLCALSVCTRLRARCLSAVDLRSARPKLRPSALRVRI